MPRQVSHRAWMAGALVLVGAVPGAAQRSSLGAISFPTSTASPAAHRAFERGVLALHSFWQPVARQAFHEAQQLDPGFALAYWGEALTYAHPLWQDPDVAAARKVLRRLGPDSTSRLAKAPTPREKGYLRALEVPLNPDDVEAGKRAYVRAMGRLVAEQPSDDEAATLYAHALHTMLPVEQSADEEWETVVALLEGVFRRNPRHPGAAHYLIHTYDDPQLAARGLPAALAYAKIAPAASHALHMPSHIFVQLGRWDDVVASNDAAFAASAAWVREEGLPANRRDYHALEWLTYGLLMQGRHQQAADRLAVFEADLRALPSEQLRAYAYGVRARLVVEEQRWESAPLPPRSVPDAPFGNGKALFAAGFAAAQRGDLSLAATVQALLDSLAMAEGETAWGRATGAMAREVGGLRLVQLGRAQDGLRALQEAVELEERIGIPSGPPLVLKPAHELLGEVLLQLGRAPEAAEQFAHSLLRTPNRPSSLLGRAQAMRAMGNEMGADRCYRALLAVWHAADPQFAGPTEARGFLASRPEPAAPSPSAGSEPCHGAATRPD